MLLLFWSAVGPSAAAPSITLRLTAVANPFATATPSITLALAPVLARQPAQATPRITLGLTVLGTQPAQASPGITLALGPGTTAQTHLATAAPAILLALEPHAIGGNAPAGSTVIELEYNATGSTITTVHRTDYEQTGVSTIVLSLNE